MWWACWKYFNSKILKIASTTCINICLCVDIYIYIYRITSAIYIHMYIFNFISSLNKPEIQSFISFFSQRVLLPKGDKTQDRRFLI